ncbi:alpha/beta hydrolase [Streptomyces sp. NPDC059373]
MTAFILVSGAHTGGWIWHEVAGRLRESGAEAYPVTLTGMGDPSHPAGPETDLETHIQDLLRLIDHVDAPEVVMVGHCYGIRVALWFFSAGALLSADWLAAPPSWLRCVAATYPVLAPLPNWGLAESRFRPAATVRNAGQLPIVVTRVGLELAEIAVTVEEFLTAAGDCKAHVEVVDVPLGHHGLETIDRTDQARDAVARAVRSVLGHLRS